MRQQARSAPAAGFEPKEEKLEEPLGTTGVGKGTQHHKWRMEDYEAVPLGDPDGSPTGEARRMIFDAPCCEGDGADLPLILGLRSMGEKQGVLEMDPKKKMLTMPGLGGYEMKSALGAIHISLAPAKSSHMTIPCDLCQQLPLVEALSRRK